MAAVTAPPPNAWTGARRTSTQPPPPVSVAASIPSAPAPVPQKEEQEETKAAEALADSLPKSTRRIVLDSGAIIKGGRVERLGDEFWTVQSVLAEIRDPTARMALKTLPFEIQVREVDPEALAFVTRFSKLTGDFTRLSATDLKVMALTYQLEREFNGTSHLRTRPLPVSDVSRPVFYRNQPTSLAFNDLKRTHNLASPG